MDYEDSDHAAHDYEQAEQDERPYVDDCGNEWYPHCVARRWGIGTPVLARRRSRETGAWKYSLFEKWRGAGSGTFEDDAGFLMLPRTHESDANVSDSRQWWLVFGLNGVAEVHCITDRPNLKKGETLVKVKET